eukprot:SAG11_NODE_17483_length_517_cov_1.102871_2_plen_40_part_01
MEDADIRHVDELDRSLRVCISVSGRHAKSVTGPGEVEEGQ